MARGILKGDKRPVDNLWITFSNGQKLVDKKEILLRIIKF